MEKSQFENGEISYQSTTLCWIISVICFWDFLNNLETGTIQWETDDSLEVWERKNALTQKTQVLKCKWATKSYEFKLDK